MGVWANEYDKGGFGYKSIEPRLGYEGKSGVGLNLFITLVVSADDVWWRGGQPCAYVFMFDDKYKS